MLNAVLTRLADSNPEPLPLPLQLAVEVPDSAEFEKGVNARDTITWGLVPSSDDD